jgi:hypothetical protein
VKRHFFLFFVLITSAFSKAQTSTIVLEGKYKGKNLYIQNPTSTEGYCTQKVLVNEKEVTFSNTSAFEIKLDSMGFKIGDSVKVELFHKNDCLPKVLNNNINPKRVSYIESISVDSNAILHWKVQYADTTNRFIVEQFRWNKWIKIQEVAGKDNVYEYSYKVLPHSGKNQFRVKVNLKDEFSRTVDYNSTTEVKIMPCSLKNEIAFDTETDYEIYDQLGGFVKKGRGKIITLSELVTGDYYLNYDNKMGQFVIKKDKDGTTKIGKTSFPK